MTDIYNPKNPLPKLAGIKLPQTTNPKTTKQKPSRTKTSQPKTINKPVITLSRILDHSDNELQSYRELAYKKSQSRSPVNGRNTIYSTISKSPMNNPREKGISPRELDTLMSDMSQYTDVTKRKQYFSPRSEEDSQETTQYYFKRGNRENSAKMENSLSDNELKKKTIQSLLRESPPKENKSLFNLLMEKVGSDQKFPRYETGLPNKTTVGRFEEFMEKLRKERENLHKQLEEQERSTRSISPLREKVVLNEAVKAFLADTSVEDIISKRVLPSDDRVDNVEDLERITSKQKEFYSKLEENYHSRYPSYTPTNGQEESMVRSQLTPRRQDESISKSPIRNGYRSSYQTKEDTRISYTSPDRIQEFDTRREFGTNNTNAAINRSELEYELIKLKKELHAMESRVSEKNLIIEDLNYKLNETTKELEKVRAEREKEIHLFREVKEEHFRERKKLQQELDKALNKLVIAKIMQSEESIPKKEESRSQDLERKKLEDEINEAQRQHTEALQRRVQELENEVKFQEQKAQELRERLNEMILSEATPTKVSNAEGNKIKAILKENMEEIESLKTEKRKLEDLVQETKRKWHESEIYLYKEIDTYKTEIQELTKKLEETKNQHKETQVTMEKMKMDHQTKIDIFKSDLVKINELVNDLAKENESYKRQIAILSDNKEAEVKIQLIEKE